MAPKKRTPAPIDRPLSRAYLREFTGWSSAYPPGISDPTSLRIMENVLVQRDGSVRVRPGLRYLSYETDLVTPLTGQPIGTHEPFFLADGTKAYLFAVVEADDTVGFRVLANLGVGQLVHGLTDDGIDFSVPQGEAALAFSSETTYVKYLQIDNKIFALSNAGESMRLFEVGESKQAKKLSSIARPLWNTADKLSVVHPDSAWTSNRVPLALRTNYAKDPYFSRSDVWEAIANSQSATVAKPSSLAARSGGLSYVILVPSEGTSPTTAGITQRVYNVLPGAAYAASAYVGAESTGRDWVAELQWLDSAENILATDTGAATADNSATWTRVSVTATAPANAATARFRIRSANADLVWNEMHFVDDALLEQSGTVNAFFGGDNSDTPTFGYEFSPEGYSYEIEYGSPVTGPTAETATVDTLISSTAADNTYNFGFFYTFANEVGETAGSQVTVVKAQRGWSQWLWETPDAAGAPSGTATSDPDACADQLVATIPADVFSEAIAQGAIKWNLYMLTWSDQDPVPVTAVLVDSRDLSESPDHDLHGWARATPQQADISAPIATLPTESTRRNYSTPSSGGQGIVAADRMVMVYDPVEPAVIRWSSNQQGNYTDFSASRGGGYKTLTSGNLFVPAVVKLWQNPQSVDTLTILCLGTDGRSTGYYMAPSQIASQSEAVNVMGFEETTATPGTTSPYGVEVLNNALYHPLDEQLMKSSATNYNINHLSLTDQIQNVWKALVNKTHIVSSQLDNRLYYLVHNPAGEELETGCWGNEVWVYDAAQKQGSWSRWLVQGQSLRKIEVGGQVVMSIVKPDGIYYFDEYASTDEYVGFGNGNLLTANQASAETDATGWRTTGLSFAYTAAGFAQSAVRSQVGTKSILITWPTCGQPVNFGSMAGVEAVVVPGQTYTFSTYVYVPTTHPDVRLEAIPLASAGASGNSVDFATDFTAVKDGWLRMSLSFTATNDRYLIGVKVDAATAGQQCWVDGAMLETGSEMSAFTLDAAALSVVERNIHWRLETNTQGANRAHDAWAHLQQANVVLGNFQGQLHYGIRGRDINGRTVTKTKVVRDSNAASSDGTLWDLEDYMTVQRDMKEWFFFAGSETNDAGETLASSGQINLVQYRYTPVSVNTGYEYGSVETFEYGRAGNAAVDRNTDNGIPMPFIDTGRP